VAKNLQNTLDALSTNAISVCATHHLGDLEKADNILYLNGGKILEQGNTVK
jgi:ABC-type transport system involved in cytochrome bd biosynthesis fused ATPase/permease subunit